MRLPASSVLRASPASPRTWGSRCGARRACVVFDELLARAKALGPMRVCVVGADDHLAREGAEAAERLGLIVPVYERTPEAAAQRAVAGDVEAIMKGAV